MIDPAEIDLPEVKAEMKAMFAEYERALMANDVAVLTKLFRRDSRTLRFGAGENLYGWEAIMAFRSARVVAGLDRRLVNTIITTYGQDFAVANTEFHRSTGVVGRQSQTWVRFAEGFRIVAAHVSLLAQNAAPRP
jgi:hypothetical protein